MIIKHFVFLAGIMILSTPASFAASVAIVPHPVSMEIKEGIFLIDSSTLVICDAAAQDEAMKLIDALAPALGARLTLLVSDERHESAIHLRLDDSRKEEVGVEGYVLESHPTFVEIRAPAAAGLYYGIQTLRQLAPPAIFRRAAVESFSWNLPCVSIVDYPRFAWRGLLLDPARHFIPKSEVLRIIDVMALHKFNRLQLHLTDDQGWRIEIKRYPKLTEVGAWREETLIGHLSSEPISFDGKRHGGFYTQEDIREMVHYAADRHIVIVPEIEMPGHARAAIAAYPELGVFPEKQRGIQPWTRWGISEDIFSPRPETIEFLQNVLLEVMELFPSEFIHIGGDEAVKTQWRSSNEVQEQISSLGLRNEEELQSWFIKQMDVFLREHGRRLIGWDEILEGGLAPGAAVMSWRSEEGGITAARVGHDVVMAPVTHTYFDYYQGDPADEPLAIGGLITLERVYEFDPIPTALTENEARHVLGAQAQLWSEYMPNARHIQYMAFPRACALIETLWSPADARDFERFRERLAIHLQRLDVMDINYRRLD